MSKSRSSTTACKAIRSANSSRSALADPDVDVVQGPLSGGPLFHALEHPGRGLLDATNPGRRF